jgi:hypothetical protein
LLVVVAAMTVAYAHAAEPVTVLSKTWQVGYTAQEDRRELDPS